MWCAPSDAQLRIVTYNTTPSIHPRLPEVLQAIQATTRSGVARPVDVLAVQEQVDLSRDTQQIVDGLNAIYGAGVYARSERRGDGFTSQSLVYNTQTIQLVDERTLGRLSSSGNARQTLVYRLRPVGYDANADFYLLNSHFKANDNVRDAQRRAVEAATNRQYADSLGPNIPVLYLGDFNLYGAFEPAFETLVASGPGQAFDPIDRVGSWNQNRRFADVHTQSTTRAGGENRAGGGMNDRFDFQLVTSTMLDGEGLSYLGPHVPGSNPLVTTESYHAFGNNGTHLPNRDLSSGSGAAPEILELLEQVSDHLPVVADYQLPARMRVDVSSVAPRVFRDSALNTEVTIQNTAPVDLVYGADELDYQLIGPTLQDVLIGTIPATADAQLHSIGLDTRDAGRHVATLIARTDSQQASHRQFVTDISYDVLEHGQPSFLAESGRQEAELSLGTVVLDDHPQGWDYSLEVFNSAAEVAVTAGIVLGRPSGDVAGLELEVPTSMIQAGDGAMLRVELQSVQPGRYEAEWLIPVMDEPIPGSLEREPLQLKVALSTVLRSQGDFDQDGQLTVDDLNKLDIAMRTADSDPRFDLDADGRLDLADHAIWVELLKQSFYGDANLDGRFDSIDLVHVFQRGEYEDELVLNSSWGSGDWNADGEFNSTDFVIAWQRGSYLQTHVAEVPESNACWLLAGSVLWLLNPSVRRTYFSRDSAAS